MAVTTAVVAGGLAIGAYSARESRRASENAADASLAGLDASTAESRRQFNIQQEQSEGARFLGTQALRQQAAMAGIDVGPGQFQSAFPQPQQPTPQATVPATLGQDLGFGGNIQNLNQGRIQPKGVPGRQMSGTSATRGVPGRPQPTAVGTIPGTIGGGQMPPSGQPQPPVSNQIPLGAIEGAAPLDPFSFNRQAPGRFDLGRGPGDTFEFEQGPTGEFRLPEGPSAELGADFDETPAQKFLRDRAERTLLRNQAATQSLGGGATKQALIEQSIGLSQQFLGEQEQQRRARMMDERGRLMTEEDVRRQRQLVASGQMTQEEAIRAQREAAGRGAMMSEEQVRAQREAAGLGVAATEEEVRRQREVDQFNRLAAVSGSGQLAQSQLNQTGLQTSAQIAAANAQAGNINAQAGLAAAQANQDFLGSALSIGGGAILGGSGALGPNVGSAGGAALGLMG